MSGADGQRRRAQRHRQAAAMPEPGDTTSMDPHGSLAAEGAAIGAGAGGMGSVSPHPAHRTSRRSSSISVAQVDAAR
jgi:hypothetical protein